MLNISPNTINQKVVFSQFNSFSRVTLSSANSMFVRWLYGTFILLLIFLFLPWTQNIQTKGKVTTLSPEHRPQTIHSTIAGRIEQWYVQEGQKVLKGDTIVYISEVKDGYFDADLIPRTRSQVDAKVGAMKSYDQKVDALQSQIVAMRAELDLKQRQLRNKINQARYKIAVDSVNLERAKIDYEIAQRQYERYKGLNEKGIESLQEVENKKLKMQDTNAKLGELENKLDISRNELDNSLLALTNVVNEYNQKIFKAESDISSTLSQKFDTDAQVSKLRIQASNYEKRSSFYYITAPQDAFINKALKPGVGETVKEGDAIVSIMPADYELAVELYVKPMDLPLIDHGNEVRFIFDGWPAIVFTGWPSQTFGTFTGEVVAIENNIDSNGKYRILVGPAHAENSKPWPDALRPGSGAEGIALLNDVPMWYEIWRQLNGFPPEYYDEEVPEEVKMKAPIQGIK
ncbi:MAG: biotin/lipoyl-binding protein [Bacteroidota bacterium]